VRSGDKPGARDKESTYDVTSAGEGETGVVGTVHDAGGTVVPVSAKYHAEVVAALADVAKKQAKILNELMSSLDFIQYRKYILC
jgi:hypothetical protein